MGWIIAGSIFVVILLLTLGKVTFIFDYKEDLILKFKYMFFPIVTFPSTKKKKKKRKKKKKAADKNAEKKGKKGKSKKDGEVKKKKSLTDILELVKLALDSLGKPLKKVIKRTEISHLAVDITCGGDDAAKTAIAFGATNLAVGNILGWIDTFFTLKKPDRIHVGIDFNSDETIYDCYAEVKLTVAAALAFAFTLLGRAIKYYFSNEKAREAIKNMV